jgi:UDP-N-acetylmuramoylalanine--D-glutamate ligase
MDARPHFAGKRITVMGLGLLGRGLGDVRYLAEQGAILTVTDLKTREQLATSLEALAGFPDISYVLGEHRLEDFRDRDLILKAAGVPLDSPYIEEAKRNRIPVVMSAAWFAQIAGIPVVGVTGTRGKSTTTHMLEAILKRAGKKVLLGGNVRGVSTLALLPEVTPDAIALMELDSWQLQGFADLGIAPTVAVFTTFFPDHLNYYKNDLDRYLADKAGIFLNQAATDTLIIGAQAAPQIRAAYGDRMAAHVVEVSDHDLRDDWTLAIPGEHNRYNAALAVEAARALDIPDEAIREALATFTGVPGRLERIATVDGVDYYNDTTATTPEATLAGLTALSAKYDGRVLAIMGGADKNLDFDTLIAAIPSLTKRVELLAGTGTDRIRDRLPEAEVFDNLAAAVGNARRHAQPGDAIVLSPAFASFGMFQNEFDRGDQFNSLVAALATS